MWSIACIATDVADGAKDFSLLFSFSVVSVFMYLLFDSHYCGMSGNWTPATCCNAM